jgi:hypothetical protein
MPLQFVHAERANTVVKSRTQTEASTRVYYYIQYTSFWRAV